MYAASLLLEGHRPRDSARLCGRGLRHLAEQRARPAALSAVAEEITGQGGEAHQLPFDVGDRAAAEVAVKSLLSAQGLDALVLNAGWVKRSPLVRTGASVAEALLSVNLTSFFYVTQPIARAFLRQRSGTIEVVSSMAGVRGLPNHSAYSAAKAGLIAASQAPARACRHPARSRRST